MPMPPEPSEQQATADAGVGKDRGERDIEHDVHAQYIAQDGQSFSEIGEIGVRFQFRTTGSVLTHSAPPAILP